MHCFGISGGIRPANFLIFNRVEAKVENFYLGELKSVAILEGPRPQFFILRLITLLRPFFKRLTLLAVGIQYLFVNSNVFPCTLTLASIFKVLKS